MQTEMMEDTRTVDLGWLRAAKRECLRYGEHGEAVEVANGHVTCFNCGNAL